MILKEAIEPGPIVGTAGAIALYAARRRQKALLAQRARSSSIVSALKGKALPIAAVGAASYLLGRNAGKKSKEEAEADERRKQLESEGAVLTESPEKAAAVSPFKSIQRSMAQALSPRLDLGRIGGRAGAVLLIGAGLGLLSGKSSRIRSSIAWPGVRRELKLEKSLTDYEVDRADDLFSMMQEFAPSVAGNRKLVKGFVSQALTLNDEGVWGLLQNLTKMQKDVSDAQPSLAKPIGLAAQVATAAKGLAG